MKNALFALIAFVLLHTAYAEDSKVVEKPLAGDTAEKFTAMATNVRAEMATGGRYQFIKASDKDLVNRDLDSMNVLLQKYGSTAAMSTDDKLKMYNFQEHANGLLVHNDANRLVCERRAPIGTNILQTVCRTYGEIERQRRDARKMVTDAEGNVQQKFGN